MKDLFSFPVWENISSLWRKDGRAEKTDPLSLEERALLEEQFLMRRAVNTAGKKHFDDSRAWEKVKRRISKKESRRISVFWRRCAAVAVVLLGVAAALFYTGKKPDEQKTEKFAGSVLSPKVELILASGDRKVLEQGIQQIVVDAGGNHALVDSRGKQLVYSVHSRDTVLEYNTLNVPRGGEYSLRLSDGTQVWLNSESSLRFPVIFSGKKRQVFLSGEAFFKVAGNAEKPFHVYAGEQDICVLGTSFNVSAYATDILWHTTLVEGAVSVRERGSESRLSPSCQYQMNRETGMSEVQVVNTDLYTSWMEGKIYFKNMSLEDIISRLQRWFDLNMFYQSEDIKKMKFRGTINRYEPMEAVFRKLEQITDLRFTIRGNTVTAIKVK